MFCRLALPKFRTLTADDEVILCSWQRVNAPELLYVTCNVNFTIDFAANAGIDTYKPVNIPFRCPVADQVADLVIFSLRATILINLNLNLNLTWSQTCVCVSQAGRKPVESQLRTGLRPGSSYLDMTRQLERVCDLLSTQKKSRAGGRPTRTCGKPGL